MTTAAAVHVFQLLLCLSLKAKYHGYSRTGTPLISWPQNEEKAFH